MNKNFDNLSDEFLNGDSDKNKPPKLNIDNIFNLGESMDDLPSLPPELLDIIKSIGNDLSKTDGLSDKLGEPDEVSVNEDGNVTSTWDTDFGSITKVSFDMETPEEGEDIMLLLDKLRRDLGIPFIVNEEEIDLEVDLEVQLKIAEEEEDYLECARLKIIIEKNSRKEKEILENSKKSEKGSNPVISKDSEGGIWDLLD